MQVVQDIYIVMDRVAKASKTPFYANNDATAIRLFKNLVNDKETQVAQNPEDYDLYRIGSFDFSTAEMKIFDEKQFLCNGQSLVEQDQKGEE